MATVRRLGEGQHESPDQRQTSLRKLRPNEGLPGAGEQDRRETQLADSPAYFGRGDSAWWADPKALGGVGSAERGSGRQLGVGCTNWFAEAKSLPLR